MAEADPAPKRRASTLRAALDSTPRPADAKHLGYGTAGFRSLAEGGLMDHVFLRVGALATLRAMKLGSVTGCMVTASHNDEPDNGVKICEAGGDMMAESWEGYASELANLKGTAEVLAFVERMIETEGIPDGSGGGDGAASAVPVVFVGMDTRPTSAAATSLVIKGVEAMGGTAVNYGLMTTPQLHHCVRAQNAGRADCSEESYFAQLVEAYQLVTTKPRPDKLVVDCSRGIGAPKLAVLAERLSALLTVELRNVDGRVNEGCGAEHVQKGRVLPGGVDPAQDQGVRIASMDGDADRLVYFYVTEGGTMQLLDGDKIATLFTHYIKLQLDAVGLTDSLKVGIVQTAYANGASTAYISDTVGVPIEFTPTGVKHLHKKAHDFDVGVYFEANGHGTVLFSAKALEAIADAPADEAPAAAEARGKLRGLTLLINQAVGDALADLLAVEAVLSELGLSVQEWDGFYADLPSRQLKVKVADRTVVRPQWDEKRLDEPAALQAEIDRLVGGAPQGRGFARPSGTEDVVRVYAEAASEAEADALALAMVKGIYTLAGGTGEMQTSL